MKIGTYYRIPQGLYWAFKRQASTWEQGLSQVLTQAIDFYVLEKGLMSIDFLQENPKELEKLLKKPFVNTRNQREKVTIGFSTTEEIGLSLHLISLQKSLSKVETLIEIMETFLNSLGSPTEIASLPKPETLNLMDKVLSLRSREKSTLEELDSLGELKEGENYSNDDLKNMKKQLRKIENLMKGGV